MPGPLPVLFRAKVAGTASRAPLLTTTGRDNYTFYPKGETYKIKFHFTCNTFNVIYMIQFSLCNLQYIGETKRRLKNLFIMNILDALYLTPPGL